MTAVEHGNLRGVRWHRITKVPTCKACRRAAADQRAKQRKNAYLRGDQARLVASCGVRRRLEALAAIGWSRKAIAAELGCDRSNVQRMIRAQRSAPETVAAVRKLYDRLSMQPGPHATAKAYAARQGWLPPLAWDDDSLDDPAARPRRGRLRDNTVDEVAVMRAAGGDRVHLRPAERRAAVGQLTAVGLSAAQIAVRLHTTQRSVVRNRGAAAQTSVA